jgi:hypothetical protein
LPLSPHACTRTFPQEISFARKLIRLRGFAVVPGREFASIIPSRGVLASLLVVEGGGWGVTADDNTVFNPLSFLRLVEFKLFRQDVQPSIAGSSSRLASRPARGVSPGLNTSIPSALLALKDGDTNVSVGGFPSVDSAMQVDVGNHERSSKNLHQVKADNEWYTLVLEQILALS